jgi:tetratricopeptide (TPR) repeat protein
MPAPSQIASVLLAAAALGACASGPTANRPAAAASAESARPGAIYGLYLNGQAALLDGRNAEAARYFNAAAKVAPNDPALRERAFVAALLAGDVDKAAGLAPAATAQGASSNQRLGRLVRAVEALADDKGAAAVAELSGEPLGFPHRAAGLLILPWAQAAAGDLAAATRPGEPGRDRVLTVFAEQGRALLLERARRHEEADAVFRALLEQAPDNDLLLLSYGGFLERRGRRPEAVALYQRGVTDEPDDVELQAALARAQSRRSPPPAPTVQQGAAYALLAPAAALAAERQGELALAYLRLTLRLDPKLDEAWLLVGDQLNAGKDREGARSAYARVRPTADEYAVAQARLAFTFEQEGNRAEALRLTEAAAAAAPNNRTVQLAYADVLRSADRNAEAAGVIDQLIARAGPEPDWRLLYLRGISHERAGNWPAAERDLQAALKANPDEPEILNYLGYAWIDRGERLGQALPMIERAVALRPESGAIVDSLGWAHYRLGRYDEAVKHLERAVELEPADPTVNDHLGDAYWRVGRRSEAQFQWRRALTLEPEPKLKADAEAKLRTGLGPAGPAPATAVARP